MPGFVYLFHFTGTDIYKIGACQSIQTNGAAIARSWGCEVREISRKTTEKPRELESRLHREFWHVSAELPATK